MNKFITAAVAAATLATAAVGTTSQAHAGGHGGAFVGGLVGGMILGGALSQASQPHYYGGYGYYDRPVVYRHTYRRCGTQFAGYDSWGNPVYQRVCSVY